MQVKRYGSTSRSRYSTRKHSYASTYRNGKLASFSGKRKRTGSAPTRKRARTNSTVSTRSAGSALARMKTSTDSIHSGIEQTRLKVILNAKPCKGVRGNTSNLCYSQSYKTQLVSTSGLQTAQSFGFGTCSQWLNSTGAAYSNIQSFTNWFGMNPNQRVSGSTLVTAGGVPLDDQLCNVRSELEISFGNFANIGGYVDIYFLKAKRDCSQTPEALWNSGYVADNYVASIITPPITATATAGGGINTIIGSKPTDVKLFNSFFKVVKVRHSDLSGGANERLKADIVANYLGKKDTLNEINTAGIIYPKGSLSVLFVTAGQIVHDSTGLGVTMGTSSVGVVINAKHHFKPVYGNGTPNNMKYMVDNVVSGSTNQQTISNVDVDQFTILA